MASRYPKKNLLMSRTNAVFKDNEASGTKNIVVAAPESVTLLRWITVSGNHYPR